MLRLTAKQARRIRRLARDQCCNCYYGNCLLLDDGETHKCVQLLNRYSICCNYLLKAVLPADEKLYEEIIQQNKNLKEET